MRPKDSVGFYRNAKRIYHSTDMKGYYKQVKHHPTVKELMTTLVP